MKKQMGSPNTFPLVYLLIITTLALVVSSCGGGGDGSGTTPDTTPPTVTATNPTHNATGVAVNTPLSATFSEALNPATIDNSIFTLKDSSNNPVSATIHYSGTTAILTPNANLAFSTLYTAVISTGVKDLAGNPLADAYFWTFTTGTAADTTPPTVTATDPTNGATGVAVNTSVSVTFSEAMEAASINSTTMTVGIGGSEISGTVTYDAANKIVTFMPSTNLAASATYTATITTGAKDLAGNAMPSSYTWSFTTGVAPDTTPPTIISTTPAQGMSDIVINTAVSATFSETMDLATMDTTTFILKDSANNPVNGVVTLSGSTVTFTPFTLLALSSTYEATITTGVKDLSGNAMGSNYTWSFTTALTAPGALDTGFGTGGVVTNNPSTLSDAAKSIAKDSSFIYVAGYDSSPGNTEWRIEKRNLGDGALVMGFGTNGVVTSNPSVGDDQANAIAIDASFLYVAGFDSSPGSREWRIEKRNLSDGALVAEFGINGVASSNPVVWGGSAGGIVIDSTFMYVVGSDGPRFLIEKRNLSDGALVTEFGEDGVAASNPSNSSTAAFAISIDSTFMYVIGTDTWPGNYEWRIEKRNLSDGALVPGFGDNGVVTSNPSEREDVAYDIAIDSSSMYVVGYQNTQFNWRIEKRNLSDGALVTGFGTNGVVLGASTNYGNAPEGIAIDPSSMYVVGYDSFFGNAGWRVEKRNLSDGAFVTGFGTNGVVTSNPGAGSDYARDVVMDSTSIYLVGSDSLPGENEWRIEKRFK